MLLSRSRPVATTVQKALLLRCCSTAAHEESAQTSASPTSASSSSKSATPQRPNEPSGLPGFPLIYPDFLREPVWGRRHPLKEKLERQDMLRRRMNIDIPEFYVGTSLLSLI
uniref:Uncharacterized protein n=1 Tax=Plectus sambesii TaxID=2011161 RepID=A0A914VAM3_9BILA